MKRLLIFITILFKLILAEQDICYQDNIEIRFCDSGYKCCNKNQCCKDYGSLWWVYVLIVLGVILLFLFFYKVKCYSCCPSRNQECNNSQQLLLPSQATNQNSTQIRPIQGNAISLQGNLNQENSYSNV